MLKSKDKLQKVEMIKKIVRQHEYGDMRKAHQQCIEMGLNVNVAALMVFAKRLKQTDFSARPSNSKELFSDTAVEEDDSIVIVAPDSTEQLKDNATKTAEALAKLNQSKAITDLDNLQSERAMSREQAIQYQLGQLKIREHNLMEELAKIKKRQAN